jgi:predicted GNAT family N-acyltransferase
MPFHVTLGDWTTQRTGAESIRTAVFLIEQSVPVELEWDEMDALSVHAVAWGDMGQPIGTGRLLPDGHIGRMAVLQPMRHTGVGRAMLTALLSEAQTQGLHTVRLNAQVQVQNFYRRFGFVPHGDEFMDAGIPHVQMVLQR